MKLYLHLFLSLTILNCGSGGGASKSRELNPDSKAKKSEASEKLTACSSFASNEDCVMAKEINFTLAYYLGAKGDSQVYSMSKSESSRPQITKLRSSSDLEDIKKRIKEEKYISSEAELDLEDMIQYIQDEKEGQSLGKSPVEVKKAREQALLNGEAKRRSQESLANKKIREKMQREIDAHPYIFEVSCMSFDDSKLELEQCGIKLKPTLKISSDKKVIYTFSPNDFVTGSVNSNLKLPKDFTLELTSSGQDSSKLLVALIKNRTIREDSSGKLVYSIGKVYTKMGQNMTILP